MHCVKVKYIALLAMAKIVPTHPELVAEHQDMILSSVDDQDVSIRMRALDLLSAMVRILYYSTQLHVNCELVHSGQQKQSAAYSATITLASGPVGIMDVIVCFSITFTIYIALGTDSHKVFQLPVAIPCIPTHSVSANLITWCTRHIR